MRRQRGCEFGGPASGILTCNNELHVRIKYLRSLPSHDNRAPSSRSREPFASRPLSEKLAASD